MRWKAWARTTSPLLVVLLLLLSVGAVGVPATAAGPRDEERRGATQPVEEDGTDANRERRADRRGDEAPAAEEPPAEAVAEPEADEGFPGFSPDVADKCPGGITFEPNDSDGDGLGDACDPTPNGEPPPVEPEPEPAPEPAPEPQPAPEPTPAPEPEPDPEPAPEGEGDGGGRPDGGAPPAEEAPADGGDGGGQTPAEGGNDGAEEEPETAEPRNRDRERNRGRPADGGNDGGAPAGGVPEVAPLPDVGPAVAEPPELPAARAGNPPVFAPAPLPPDGPPPVLERFDPPEAGFEPLVRIDAGATAPSSRTARDPDEEPGDGGGRRDAVAADDAESDPADGEASDEDRVAADDEETGDGDPADDGGSAGSRDDETADDETGDGAATTTRRAFQSDGASEEGDAARVTAGDADPSEATDDEAAEDDLEVLDGEPPTRTTEATSPNAEDAKRAERKRARAARRDANGGRNGGERSARDRESTESRAPGEAEGADDAPGGAPAADWDGDDHFTGGVARTRPAVTEIGGTKNDALYLSERRGDGDGDGEPGKFAYEIPVPEDGTYRVRLHFAELYWGADGGAKGDAGRRVFDVVAEGTTELADYDIFDDVGAMTAVVKQFDVEVGDGELDLLFVGMEDEPTVAGIEVLGQSAAGTGERWVDVDKSSETVRLMIGEEAVARFAASMSEGNQDDFRDTMPGSYEISSKIAELTYTPYARNYFMYWAGFDPGRENGFHSWVMDRRGRVVPNGDGPTWGCVATSPKDAAKIYGFVEIGTRVEVHW